MKTGGFACPACGGREARPWVSAPDPRGAAPGAFAVVRCETCGLGVLHPKPAEEVIRAAYGGDYGPHRAPDADGRGPRRRRPAGTPGKVLVVGAGGGSEVAHLRAAGWEAAGIEPDPRAVAAAVAAGLPVARGTAEEGPFPPGSFDLVWFPSSFEHVRDPVAALSRAGRSLTPGGSVWVWTQNPDSWTARRYGADWVHLDPPRHLWHFSRDALLLIAGRAGLRVVRLRTRSRPRGWLASAEIAAARRGAPRSLRRSRLRKALVRPLCWAADLAGAGDLWEAEMVALAPRL